MASALQAAKASDYPYPARTYSELLAHVCASALGAEIEVEYVRLLVRKFNLRAPRQAPDAWPWAVKVFTLGRFEVSLDDVPLRFEGKTPRRPLTLLKAIVALGGRDVPMSRLVDLLWPDEEGDAGSKALGVALLRLRKLLGKHDALAVTDEQISLNPDLVWVDAQAFERLTEQADRQLLEAQPAGAQELLQQVLGLYQGNFLPGDGEQPWGVKHQLRLRGMLARIIENIGAHLEEHGEWDRARVCYQRGVEADELAEEFYLGLMRCYRALHRPAEGIAVFRRLRQTLSVVLGVAPSPGAENLLRTLREPDPARPL
jgi:DNA-binding SARP family transcriptional activator